MRLLPLNGSVAKVAHSPVTPLDCRLAYRRPTVTNSRRATTLYITLLTLCISTKSVHDGNPHYMARRVCPQSLHAHQFYTHGDQSAFSVQLLPLWAWRCYATVSSGVLLTPTAADYQVYIKFNASKSQQQPDLPHAIEKRRILTGAGRSKS